LVVNIFKLALERPWIY